MGRGDRGGVKEPRGSRPQMCGCPRMSRVVLEVQGVPPDLPEELLILYFESRRRSGGGPVQSCQRLGPLLFLTFEDPRGKRGQGVVSQFHLGALGWSVRRSQSQLRALGWDLGVSVPL